MTKKVVQKGVVFALFLMAMLGFASAGFDTLKINEFSSSPINSSDWVELFYPTGNGGIDTGYCLLRDNENNELQLSGVIFSGGIGYYNWSNKLNNEGDTISLVCQGEIVDQVTYGGNGTAVPPSGISSGRCPESGYDTNNDASDFALMNPSKGGVNDCSGYSSLCGNDQIDEGEQCDAGEGNGLQCNPAYGASCTYCSIFCTLQSAQGGFCGNSAIEGNEQCDDGNSQAGDGCSRSCRRESTTGGDGGVGIGIDVETEDFVPLVWMCDNRVVYDDATEPGRMTGRLEPLYERMNNYAFEGEKIQWNVLVMDKNKIDQNIDVYATIGDSQGEGNDIEVNCARTGYQKRLFESCNARIFEEDLEWNPETMDFFTCTLTVETPESMQGEFWVTVEAQDGDGLMGTFDENEYWFFNPEIALGIDGELEFENVRPGTSSYSDTILVSNEAEDGSGVRMDMFISGTDFYDSSSSGARCPDTNQLSLDAFSYFVTHGAYSSQNPFGIGYIGPMADAEGYKEIVYGIGFNNPNPFYNRAEILPASPKNGPYYQPNILSPGSEMALTFRLDLPEPCNGDFDTGSIYFWGEAI